MENKEDANKQEMGKEYIIPFIHRQSLLLSISFRSLNIEMGEFIMKVESLDNKECFMTGECETTMVPKFQIDFKNKTLNYLNKTKYPKYNIYLLNKNKEEIHKFYVDLGRLSFLGQELRNVSIYHYPIIILEFMTGYFTTEELFEKNQELSLEFTKEFEIMEKPLLKQSVITATNKPGITDVKEPKENIKESQIENTKNNQETKNNIFEKIESKSKTAVLANEKLDKEILSKSVMPPMINKKAQSQPLKTKIQCTNYFSYIQTFQMLKFYIDPQETSEEKKQNFKAELEAFNENLERYKRKIRIIEMEKQIEFLKRKNEAIKELNKDLEESIKQKKENLEKVTNQLKPNKINYENKLNQLKANLNGRGQYQLIYDSFVYQKMAEICFVFFNNKIPSLYTIPPFYNEAFSLNDSKKMERLFYYNKENKNISAMMGHISQLLIYLSKTFNIPLRFPIFLNGSKSYILRTSKDKDKLSFLPLYFDAKKDDKHGNFENALNCLKDDIKEVFNFLSMFPEIITRTDNENVNNMNGKYLFFFFFVVFNHSLFRFMKTLQNAV